MLKPLIAAALAASAYAAPSYAAPSTECVDRLAYQIGHNPVRALPYGGGGGEPHTPMPGDPVGYVQYDVAAAIAAAKCLAS